MCVNKQPCHLHGLPVLCERARHTRAHRAPCATSAIGAGWLGALSPAGARLLEAVTVAAKQPTEQRGSPAPAPSSPQLGTALIGPLRARIGVGKQNHSSERTAERGQRKSPSDTVVPLAHPVPPASGEVVPRAQRRAQIPRALSTRQWSEEEPAASTVQLPPELLRQRAADPNPAQMLFNSSMNTIGSHKSSPNGNSHNVLESKHYKKDT